MRIDLSVGGGGYLSRLELLAEISRLFALDLFELFLRHVLPPLLLLLGEYELGAFVQGNDKDFVAGGVSHAKLFRSIQKTVMTGVAALRARSGGGADAPDGPYTHTAIFHQDLRAQSAGFVPACVIATQPDYQGAN